MQQSTTSRTSSPVRFGPFELDRDSGELRKHGLRLKLDGQPLELLKQLVEREGEIVTREELKQRLWPADTFVDFEHSINAAVKRLRHALGDSAEAPRFIETLPRRGYRFICPLNPAISVAEHRSAPVITRRSVLWGATVVALVMAAIVLVYWWRVKPQQAPKISSLAVLPLTNVSGDPTQDYFADGITDGVTTDVAKIRGIKVISHTSTMQYKGTSKTLPVIGRELNVDAIIEGTVLRSGNRIRITVQLIQTWSDTHLWAETYERDLGDVIALQDEVATAVAGQVKATIAPTDEKQLARKRSINPKAYEFYLKGRHYFGNRMMKKAAASFAEAIKLQPDYAEAYAGLGDSYTFYSTANAAPPDEALSRGRPAVLQALQIDSNVAEAHASLAWAKMTYDWDWAGAEQEFKLALALNPNYETAHLWYGCELVWEKRFDEGLAQMKMAQELAPAEPWITAFYGMGLYQARQYTRAIGELKQSIDLNRALPVAHSWLGLTYLSLGKKNEALAELETAVHYAKDLQLRNSAALSRLGYADGIAGRRSDAQLILEQLRTLSTSSYVPAIHFAVVYIGLGERDRAFTWLQKAYEERSEELTLINVDPRFDGLRSDPRFQDLIHRLNFPVFKDTAVPST